MSLEEMDKPKEVLTREFAEKRKEQIGKINYDLFLRFESKSEKYFGKCVIKFELNKKGEGILLESISNIKKILVNGEERVYERDEISIKLNDGLEEGKENEVEIEYDANYDHTGSGLHQFIDPEDDEEYIYSDFEPYQAHRMFPCFDQPDLKATLKLTIEAPKKWEVISNEKGKEEGNENSKTVYFPKTKKLSTYLFHVSLGNYEYVEDSFEGMEMRIYFRKAMKKYVHSKEMFELTKQGLKFYSEFFSYPHPFSKYDQIFVPESNSGAMENPGAITFSERLLVRHTPTRNDRADIANVVLHEMAHMWFGNLVTMKWWDDLWLNESFADFISFFAMVRATEFKDGWEHFYARKSWAYYQDQLITTHPIAANAEDTDIAFSNFDGISYSKGAAVLKQLMFYIGEENFKKGMEDYFKKYEWSNTKLEDFLECLEKAYGKDLKKWFGSWIETTGVNSTIADFNFKENKLNDLKIIQKPSNTNNLLREHKTKLAFFYEDNNETKPKVVKDISYDGTETEIRNLNLDEDGFCFVCLNYEDNDYIKDGLDKQSLEYLLKNIGKVKDSLAKQMVYGSLWQMVRDTEFDPKEFLNLVLRNAFEEDKTLLLKEMFLRVKEILMHYLNDKNFHEYCNKFFDISLEALNSEIDMETKNIWFSLLMFVSDGVNLDKFETIINILEGNTKFDNFEFDPDKRWNIVIKCCVTDHEKANEFLEKEKLKDKSDNGQKMAAVAEASKLENKKKFWDLYVSGKGKSLDYIGTAMNGFYWRIQKEKLKDYIDLFFKDVENVFEKQDKYYAKNFFRSLFPSLYVGEEVLKKVKNYLEFNKKLHKLLRKNIEEGIDELERSLRILKKYD